MILKKMLVIEIIYSSRNMRKNKSIGLGKWNIKSDIGTASYLALGNRKKNSEFD